MVAPGFCEINGRVDGVGGSWPNELSPSGTASGSLYEERGMDDSRKISLLRHRDAATHRSNSADCNDGGRSADQIGRQSVAPGQRGRDGHLCSGVNSRSEEHTSELQSHSDLVCRLLLEKKK